MVGVQRFWSVTFMDLRYAINKRALLLFTTVKWHYMTLLEVNKEDTENGMAYIMPNEDRKLVLKFSNRYVLFGRGYCNKYIYINSHVINLLTYDSNKMTENSD